MALVKDEIEKAYPDWQVRKYRRLIKLFVTPSFNRIVHHARADNYPAFMLAPIIIFGSKLPLGCYKAVVSFIENMEPFHGHELMKLIEPEPIEYLEASSDKNNLKKYQEYISSVARGGVLLAIPSYTSREEINEFLDRHFAKDIQPIIGSLGRVSRLSSVELAVAAMRAQGQTYEQIERQISEVLSNENEAYSQEDLRKMYSRFMKRKP